MSFLIALILGIVQGLTEFLPVSSSGHLVVLERLTGFYPPVLTFHVFLHAGTMLAIVITLRSEFARILREFFGIIRDCRINLRCFFRSAGGHEVRYVKILRSNYRKVTAIVTVSSCTSSLIVWLFLQTDLPASRSLFFTGVGFWITGIILLVTEKVQPGSEIPKDVPLSKTILIGLGGGAAALSGISGLAVMSCIGIYLGFNKKSAVRIAWMTLVPIELIALVYQITASVRSCEMDGTLLGLCMLGALASAVTGALFFGKARQLLRVIRFESFAKYCFWFGIAAVLLEYLLKDLI